VCYTLLSITAALGRSPEDFLLDSYRGLYLQYREAHGFEAADMLFADVDA